MAAALPTRTFIRNGARFVMAEQVAPRYTDRMSSALPCIGTAFAVRIHYDKAKRACVVLTVTVALARHQNHTRERHKPNSPAKTRVPQQQTITGTHVLTGTLAPP